MNRQNNNGDSHGTIINQIYDYKNSKLHGNGNHRSNGGNGYSTKTDHYRLIGDNHNDVSQGRYASLQREATALDFSPSALRVMKRKLLFLIFLLCSMIAIYNLKIFHQSKIVVFLSPNRR